MTSHRDQEMFLSAPLSLHVCEHEQCTLVSSTTQEVSSDRKSIDVVNTPEYESASSDSYDSEVSDIDGLDTVTESNKIEQQGNSYGSEFSKAGRLHINADLNTPVREGVSSWSSQPSMIDVDIIDIDTDSNTPKYEGASSISHEYEVIDVDALDIKTELNTPKQEGACSCRSNKCEIIDVDEFDTGEESNTHEHPGASTQYVDQGDSDCEIIDVDTISPMNTKVASVSDNKSSELAIPVNQGSTTDTLGSPQSEERETKTESDNKITNVVTMNDYDSDDRNIAQGQLDAPVNEGASSLAAPPVEPEQPEHRAEAAATLVVSEQDQDCEIIDVVGVNSRHHHTERLEVFESLRMSFVAGIGHGSNGSVYLVQTEDRLHFAAKVFLYNKADQDENERMKRTFHSETSILHSLDHINIIKLVLSSEGPSYGALFLDYCEGGAVYNHIHLLNDQLICRFFIGIVSAVNYMHCLRIIHRDIRLPNILVKGNDAILTDFGLSKKLGHESNMVVGFYGTNAFMAPEVLAACHDHSLYFDGIKADAYALGMYLWALLMKADPIYGQAESLEILEGMVRLFAYSYNPVLLDCVRKLLVCNPVERIAVTELWDYLLERMRVNGYGI